MSALKHKRLWIAAGATGAVAIVATGVAMALSPDEVQDSTAYDEIPVDWRDMPADADVPTGDSQDGCEINVLAGSYSSDEEGGEVTAGSASGEYLLGSAGSDSVLWHDGKYQVLEEDGSDLDPVDVNSSGTVIGMDTVESDKKVPFVYRDGEFHELAAPADDEGVGLELLGINDDGDIIGSTYEDDGLTEDLIDGFKWDAEDPSQEPQELPGFVKGLNEDGYTLGATGEAEAFKWDAEGNGEEIPDRDLSEKSLSDRGIVDYSGDWVLSGEEVWNVAESGDPKESEIDNIAAVDSAGNAYGSFGGQSWEHDNPPGAEIDGEAIALPVLNDGVGTTNGRGVNVVSEDGTVMAGESMDSGAGETVWPVAWSCQR